MNLNWLVYIHKYRFVVFLAVTYTGFIIGVARNFDWEGPKLEKIW